jgi:hypothetical protein
VRWLGEARSKANGPKTEPVDVERSKNRTGDSSESEPAERFKNRTERETNPKNTNKQHDDAADDASESFRSLRDAGFDDATAQQLARRHSITDVKNQIDWLNDRKPSENRLGMLRKALEENWAMPPTLARERKKRAVLEKAKQEELQQAAEDTAVAERKRQRRQRREVLLRHWQRLSTAEQKRHHQAAIAEANSEFLRRKLRGHADLAEPPIQSLEVMARAASL